MSGSGDSQSEMAAWRDRLLLLREAGLRINESLDLETVLQGVLDSARELTGARYGLTLLYGDDRWIDEHVASGMTADELHGLATQTGVIDYHRFFGEFDEPVRISDFGSYTSAQGLPLFDPPFEVNEVTPFLSVPIRHRGERLGLIVLCDKDPTEPAAQAGSGPVTGAGAEGFSVDDEELLVMFASQAALIISNARQHREEQRARSHLEAVINAAAVGVVVVDLGSGAATWANREFKRILAELRLPDVPLEKFYDHVTCRRDGRELALEEYPQVRAVRSGEAVAAEELHFEGPEGHSIAALVNATPLLSPSGEVESVVVTAQDMTPLAELERLRSEFLGMVGHELRAPLAGIKGSATTLLEAGSSLDPAEVVQYQRIINDQADHMRDLISDLIDVVRIDTGTLPVTPEACDVAALIDEARRAFLSAGGRDNIHLKVAPDLPAVMADRRRIVQVINNLLTNAARNSHETSTIRLDAVSEGVYVAVSVTDSGRGVPAERLPHLFEKFSRDVPDHSRDLGLGLAICKGIVEAHGGRIWAESDGLGLGSRFTFTVPTSEHTPTTAETGRAPSSARAPRGGDTEATRILAVDDDPRVLKLVRDALNTAGLLPAVTGDPQQLGALIEEFDPHVVLLDVMLAGADGIEIMADMLAVHDVPVIVLSSYDQDDMIARAFEMGAVDYVVKPFSPTELVARINAAKRKTAQPHHTYKFGDLEINYTQRTVTVAGQVVDLTPTEYRVLAELSTNAGVALTHHQLLQKAWTTTPTADARPLRTVIKNLRRKLGDTTKNPTYIITVPHTGYRMPKPHPPSQTTPPAA